LLEELISQEFNEIKTDKRQMVAFLVNFFLPSSRALECLHKKVMTHRDYKYRNILYNLLTKRVTLQDLETISVSGRIIVKRGYFIRKL